MSTAAVEYVRRTVDGGWLIAESGVSLDSVVCAYWEGKSPEAIVEEFPTLSAEQVYGAIAFYLRHKQEIDRYLVEQDTRWSELERTSHAQHGALLDRLRARRRAEETPQADAQ